MRHSELKDFVPNNIYLIMQKDHGWISENSDDPIQEKLFDLYVQHKWKRKETYNKKIAKGSRNLLAREFNDAIRYWLEKNYKYKESFVHIDKNIYLDMDLQRAAKNIGDPIPCDNDCGENSPCFNVTAYMECDDTCRSSNKCCNQEAQLPFDISSVMEVFYINKDVGVGVRAKRDLREHEFLGIFAGVYLNKADHAQRKRTKCQYTIDIGADGRRFPVQAIDPRYYGNQTRFINHSCNPNCETMSWIVAREWVVKVRAKKTIYKVRNITIIEALTN